MIRSIISIDKHMAVDPTAPRMLEHQRGELQVIAGVDRFMRGMPERLSGMTFRSRMRAAELLAAGHVNFKSDDGASRSTRSGRPKAPNRGRDLYRDIESNARQAATK
jgi:hypothetical protein